LKESEFISFLSNEFEKTSQEDILNFIFRRLIFYFMKMWEQMWE